jgi:pyruvate/oxaloacetate carboxyltransferase
MGISHREAEILEETARVREDLGYPILVSPFAQYIVTQAVLNVMQGERYKTIPDEIKLYLKGHYGKLAGTPSALVMERAKVDYDASRRPGELIEPALPGLRKKWGRSVSREQLSLHAFYPENLALGLKDGAQAALQQGPVLQPFTELVKYLVMKKEYKNIRTKLGGIELSFSS